jgi:prevent-host-death family protein
MEVSVSAFRADLRAWLARARAGEEVVITDRGAPVARLLGVDSGAVLERLTAEGVIARPSSARRPKASGRRRPRARGPVSTLVSEQRQ